MSAKFHFHGWRLLIGGLVCLGLTLSSSFAQVRPVTGIMAQYEAIGDTNDNYSVRGAGSGDYPTSTVYNLAFNSTEQNNLIIRGFETGTNVYNYVQLAQRINIVRVNNPNVTGLHNIVFFEEDAVASSNVNLKPSLVTTMVNSLRSDLVNRGADNVFANQGDGNGNNNNIERIDYIFNAGFPYYNFTDQRGFLVMDRGGNDRFKIAVILAIDTNGLPTAFSRPVSVLDSEWGPSGITLATTVMRGYTEGGAPLRPSARTSSQSLSGVYLSWDQFGLTTNDMVYGYSLAGNDVSTNGAHWTQVTNAAYFPTDTTVDSAFGGLDLISGGAMFFDEVLEVGIGDRVWEDWNGDGIQDAIEPGLSNVLVHIYAADDELAATARSDSNGYYFAQGMGPGTYTVQFFPPDGYQFSPKFARTDPDLDSDPDSLSGVTDPYVLGSGQTNRSADAGLFLTPGNLRLSKTVSATNVNIGNEVVYTLVLTNAGIPNTALIQVTDALPSAFVFSGYGASSGTYSAATGIWDVGALAPGGAASLAITGSVNIGSGGSWVTNTASITRMNRPDTNLTDNSASAVFHVQSADLSVSKQADKTEMEEGEAILFAIAVTNLGPNTASGIRINDLLPAGFVFAGAVPSQGTYSNTTGAWMVGTLTNGQSASLEISATAAIGAGGLHLTNTASVGASSHEDPEFENNSESVVVLVYGADLALAKRVEPLAAVELQTVAYTITITNPGPSEATGIQVSEPLTNGLIYASHAVSQGSYASGSGLWTLGTLGVNASATLTIQATVAGGTMNTTITNRARITATDLPDPDADNDEDTAELSVSSLVLTKTSDVDVSVHPGDTIVYTVVASNSGAMAHTNVALSDLVPAGTVFVPGSLSVTRTPASPTTNFYADSATFVAPAGVTSITVEAWGGGGGGGRARGNPATGGGGAGGAFAKRTIAVVPLQSYTVTVGAGGIGGYSTGTDSQHGSAGGASWFGTTNTVFAQGGARGLSDGNTNYFNGAAGTGSSALSVGDTVYRGGHGGRGNYNTASTNRSGAGGGGAGTTGAGGDAYTNGIRGAGASLFGGDGAYGVTNSRAGSGGATYGGGGSGGKANTSTDRNGGNGADGLVRITYEPLGDTNAPPDLASGWTLEPGQKLQATFSVLVDDPLAVMAITNTATASSDWQIQPVSATIVDPVIQTDLAIGKTASVTSLEEGEAMVFTLTVTNQSSQEMASGVTVVDLLPAGFEFVGSVPSQGAYDPGTGVWTVGTIAASSSATLALNVEAAAGAGGYRWTNTTAITAYDQVDPVLADNTAGVVVLVEGADLALTKVVDNSTPNETSPVTYTIRLTNSGPSDVAGVVVSEPLTNGLTYVSDSPSQGTYDSGTGLWSVGSLATGDVAVLTLTAQVEVGTFGTMLTNRSRIAAADLPDPVAANNQDEAIVSISGLRVRKTSDVTGYATPGDTITYVIEVSNLSTIAHTGIRISDLLPTGTVFVAGSLSLTHTSTHRITNSYSSSSTFTTPYGVTNVTVEAWGGGGGGGRAMGNPATGGGGAGGAYARKDVTVSEGQTYSVTVGAGGAGGTASTTNGLAGSNSWFGTTNTVFAQGGARGMGTTANSNNAAAGAGSSALSVGDLVYRGGNGSTGTYLSGTGYYSGAGGGGAGSTGNGGHASDGTGGAGTALLGGNGANGVTNNRTGADGSVRGGGGSGGKANTTTDQDGGNGANGLVQVSYLPKGYTNTPPNLASNWALSAGASLTVTFQALVVNPGSVTQLLNTASVSCDQQPTPVTASVADSVRHTDLAITKIVDDAHPDEGELVTYTLVVTNFGPAEAGSILVSEPLTNGLTYAAHSAGQGTYNSASGVWSLGTLAMGESAQLQISATVDAGTAGTWITNRAWISGADKADLVTGDNAASVAVNVVSVDVGIGKSADSASPVENGLLIYTLAVTNFGPDVATGVEITDALPTNALTYLSHATAHGTFNGSSGLWSVGTLDPLEVATLAITALVKTNTAGKAITNIAAVTAVDQVDLDSGNDSDSVVATPGTALLVLSKIAEPAGPVSAGDVIAYTIAVTNRSGLTQTNVTVTDPLPAGAVYVADSCQVNAPATINETFGDQFSRRVYSNNDGSQTWAGDWVEAESNGPTAGSIQIQFDNGVDETYTLRFSGGSQNVRRTANLSTYTSALLEFDYQRIGLEAGEYVAIQISTNGSTWTELARFQGAATDADYIHYSSNITAYIASATSIRFLSPSGMDSTDILWVDDIVITGTRRANLVAAGGAPPDLASGHRLEPGESMSVQFAVWVANPALYTQIVNQASLTSAQMPTPQIASAVTPVETCFTAAPEGLHADPTNITAFTARWTEVPGAFGYRLDVATNPAFAAGDYVSAYSNRAVSGTVQAVTGLTHDVLYYFRVRAEWDSLCTSANSQTQMVQTLGLPIIAVYPEELDFGTVDVGDLAELTLTVTNSGTVDLDLSSIAFAGGGYEFFTVLPATSSIPAGNSIELTVTFEPTAGGTNELTMTLFNNSPDFPELGVPVRGIGFDPAAQAPELLAYHVTDAAGLTNEVTDRSLGNEMATATFTLYHIAGITMEGASFDLIYPDGSTAAFTNAVFETISPANLGGRDCQVLGATIPRFFPALLGTYTLRVTVSSSNGVWLTDAVEFTSVDAGAATPEFLDDFGRADALNTIGEGWLSVLTGPVPGNIQIRNRVLQLYGSGGSGGTNGRISVVRDLSSRYLPVLTNNAGTMTWAFNFYSGRAAKLGYAPGAYGAAFVLGADSTDWVNGAGNGYAVRICSNQVALAMFTGGLDLDSDLTTLGNVAALNSSTSSLAVKVELETATGVWRLFVRELAGSGIGAFGNPLTGTEGYQIAEVTNSFHLHRALPYAGCYWNHGNAPVNTNTAAYFDDLYAPFVMPESEPMLVASIDNDIMLPTALGLVKVNEEDVPEEVPTRFEVVWTNAPEFIVTFDPLASDQDPGYTTRPIQRDVTGIGEYRVSPDPVNVFSASNRGARGRPFPVVTTNGALANYGFEIVTTAGDWVLDSHSAFQSRATDPALAYEGSNSLRQTVGGVAVQTFEFRNAGGVTPKVKMTGWYRGGPASVEIAAYSTNDSVTPIETTTLSPAQASEWTSFSMPEQELGDSTAEFLKVSLKAPGGQTYWDCLKLSIDIGTNRSSMRFRAGAENQGLVPQYLYAVDADYARPGDRLGGLTKYFYIPFDMTPPTPVPMPAGGNGASTETVDDPTTQFDLQWSTDGLGPDDPGSPVHPTKLPGDIDLFSRWHSYKIYYGTYDSQNVPLDDDPTSTNSYIYKNFVANEAFRSWTHVNPDSPIADPSAPDYQSNYLALTNMSTSSIRLYDLDYDQDYAVVVVGVDKAGNEGSVGVQSWSTNNTIRFALIRGEIIDKDVAKAAFPEAKLDNTNTPTAAALHWIASGPTNAQGLYTAVSKDYDLISWDSYRFQENSNNQWKLVDTVRSNWFVDDGGQMKPRGQLRFYRASYKDRWRATNALGQAQRRVASEEVYAMHNVVLSPGPNFVSLHGVPYTNTFRAIFGGTETFPGGLSAMPDSGSTVVEFYNAGTNALSGEQYFLTADNQWLQVGGDEVTDVLQPSNFFCRGFSITLPNPLPDAYTNAIAYDANLDLTLPAMIWTPILEVPTNGLERVIYTGNHTGRTTVAMYNLVALTLPVCVHPSEMQLLESGFVNGNKSESDQIYTINTSTKTVREGSTIYCDPAGVWRFVTSDVEVPAGFFAPNDVLVIVSKNGGVGNSWTWRYHPAQYYSLPTRWMAP